MEKIMNRFNGGLLKMFNKKGKEFVELSIGKAYFKPIINKIMTKVEILATQGNVLNSALYYLLMEKEIVMLSKRQYNNLTITDSNKLRAKTKEILIREGLITEEVVKPKVSDEANIFSKRDSEWFDGAKRKAISKLRG